MSANRYSGTCGTCHTRVGARTGWYDGNLWCAEPVRYDGMLMCPTAAHWQEAADKKTAERRAAYVAPEPNAEDVARRQMYAARAAAWEAEGKRECPRCGGNGGSQHWPGFTCYGCAGRGYQEVSA